VVCGWVSESDSVGSSKIVFRHNAETGKLEYIGYAPIRNRRVTRIYKIPTSTKNKIA
jgi:hypothetical protein